MCGKGGGFFRYSLCPESIEQVAAVMGNSPRWFQLYWGNDPDLVLSMVRRSESSSHTAIVLIVDRPVPAGGSES